MVTTLHPNVKHRTIEVLERDRDRWQAALDRFTIHIAHRNGAVYQFRSLPSALADGTYRSYDIASYSTPGTFHLVELFRLEVGLFVRCDCTAGELVTICQHAAGAIDDAGWWPFEVAKQLDLIESPVSQAPPALYRVGQLVRHATVRRTAFSITGMHYDPQHGWLCRLETLARVAWPEPVSELDLVPYTSRKRRAA